MRGQNILNSDTNGYHGSSLNTSPNTNNESPIMQSKSVAFDQDFFIKNLQTARKKVIKLY
jgi:hypothetical protein